MNWEKNVTAVLLVIIGLCIWALIRGDGKTKTILAAWLVSP
jgi:hypothetical protein